MIYRTVNLKSKGIESLPQTLNFLIPASLQPNLVNLWYFKLTILVDKIVSVWNRFTPFSFIIDIEIGKLKFVAKTQFLYKNLDSNVESLGTISNPYIFRNFANFWNLEP